MRRWSIPLTVTTSARVWVSAKAFQRPRRGPSLLTGKSLSTGACALLRPFTNTYKRGKGRFYRRMRSFALEKEMARGLSGNTRRRDWTAWRQDSQNYQRWYRGKRRQEDEKLTSPELKYQNSFRQKKPYVEKLNFQKIKAYKNFNTVLSG